MSSVASGQSKCKDSFRLTILSGSHQEVVKKMSHVTNAISIPEALGFFVSGWSPEETLGQWNGSGPGFLVQNNRSLHETANQKKDISFEFPRVSPGDQLLTKKPEDSGIKIGHKVVKN